MSMFNKIKENRIKARQEEEHFYQLAITEIESGSRRPGLWAKALAERNGNIEEAQARYIQLLAIKLKDESHIFEKDQKKIAKPKNHQPTKSQIRAKEKSQQQWINQNKKSASPTTASGLGVGCLAIIAITAAIFVVLLLVGAFFEL